MTIYNENLLPIDTQTLVSELIFERLEVEQNESTCETPERIVKALNELTKGIDQPNDKHLETTFQSNGYDELVTVKDIEFYSLCEHHFLPFFGKAHVGYIPDDKVTGLSKISRTVELISSQPQMQERLTDEISNTIHETLEPIGTVVVLQAGHLCMKMRGVEDQTSKTITSSIKGAFEEHHARSEFFELVDL